MDRLGSCGDEKEPIDPSLNCLKRISAGNQWPPFEFPLQETSPRLCDEFRIIRPSKKHGCAEIAVRATSQQRHAPDHRPISSLWTAGALRTKSVRRSIVRQTLETSFARDSVAITLAGSGNSDHRGPRDAAVVQI